MHATIRLCIAHCAKLYQEASHMADFDEIIRMVAKAHNSTPETVLKEMQESICLAHQNADPTVRAQLTSQLQPYLWSRSFAAS